MKLNFLLTSQFISLLNGVGEITLNDMKILFNTKHRDIQTKFGRDSGDCAQEI